MTRIQLTTALAALFLSLGMSAQALSDGAVIRLYEGAAPGSETWTHSENVLQGADGQRSIFNVADPVVTAYLPAEGTSNGTAMLVCPGGGFMMLSYDGEGEMVARELNRRGITAFVLKYRLEPMSRENGYDVSNGMSAIGSYLKMLKDVEERFEKKTGRKPNISESCFEVPSHRLAFADADKAMTLIRENAKAWGLQKDRIGIVGFSAGAITTINQALHHTSASRPDFVAPIYGGWVEGIEVPEDAAPLFMCSPATDVFTPEESLNVYLPWHKAGVPAELHYFHEAKHGFGANVTGKSVDGWIDLMCAFMKDCGFLE
jgi:acetyl esterase/lipase